MESSRRRGVGDQGSQESSKIRVLIADSQRLVADSLAEALGNQPDLAVFADRPLTAGEAIDVCLRRHPAVALIDYWMPDMEGPAATRIILAKRPDQKVILLSWFHSPGHIESALDAGAVGFFPKSLTLVNVAEGIRRAHAGESPVFLKELESLFKTISGRIGASTTRFKRLEGLTKRELELLALFSLHLSADEVAQHLSISPTTVKAHVRHILVKTGAHSTREVVNLAIASGLIRP